MGNFASVASTASADVQDFSANHLRKLLNAVPHQKIDDWKAVVGHTFSGAAKDTENFFSSSGNIGDIQTFIPALEKLFKSLAQELETHQQALIARLTSTDWTDPKTVLDALRPILDRFQSVFDFIKDHPWVLLPLLIPAFEVFLVMLGFGAEGVAAGSIAAALQSYIGKVGAGSLFAFCQSVGAGGWAATVLLQSEMLITIGVLLAATVQVLVEKEIIELGKAKEVLESVWARVDNKFSAPPVPNGGSDVAVLNLGAGWAKVGLCVWAGVHVATFALDQSGY